MYFSAFGLLLGLFNGMRALEEKCDNRYCYNVVGQVLMNNTKEILDICQSTSPPSQLLSIFDSDIQKSVETFFVTASGGKTSTIVLALQKNANGEWIWISTSASQSFTNWKDGNPVFFQGSDCTFFTPEESSKWWNSICSSKIVTVVCMRAQNSQTFTTNSPQTPRTTKGQTTTTTTMLNQPNVRTPAISTTTTLIPTTTTILTTTATSTTIQLTTTTTTTSTTPATSTFTTTSTTSATATVPTATNGRLPQPSTATSLSSSSTRITSPSTSSGPVDNASEKSPTDLSEGETFKKNLGIGLGVSLSLGFIICLIIAILVAHFFNKKNRKNSKFSSVVDIDHVKHYMAQSPQIIPPDVVSDLGNAEDRRSSDSGFDMNEDTKTKPVEHVENIDTHSVLNDDNVEVERPESTNSVHSVWPIDTSTESGLDEPEEPRFDWDYATNTGASKKSIKKVSFDLEHVVEIPN